MVQLVLILAVFIGVSAGTCPNMCQCRNYPRDDSHKTSLYYTSVTCNTYTENITDIDSATRDFQISNLNTDELTDILNNLDDRNLPYLKHLIITKSEINNYFNFSAPNLGKILSLSLTENLLKSVSELYLNLSNLNSLDLSRNVIKVIDLAPFRTLQTLEVLNLSANALSRLSQTSFSGLINLKCLDLSANNLQALDDEVLLPLSSLQYLNLSNNRLEALNEVCFSSLVMLQQLDVSWNRLARVAPGTMQLPSLARLLLAGNPQLGKSHEASVLVGTGRKLQTLDASRTGLKQVPAALTHSIRTLRLAGNSIRSVVCGDLDSYPLLQLLDFTSNDLEVIEEDALGRQDSLSILYLSDNNIGDVPKSLPEKLKVLHLERNAVEKVSDKDLQGLSELEVLLLSDNKIRAIDEAAFSQLVSLVTLDLSRNPISILRPGCLAGPSALQVLRLESIDIISPAEDVSFPLSAPEHLIVLDLAGSPGLARQLLADTAALAASRELQELDLSRTEIEFIRSDLLHYLPQLRALHIKYNRLNCTHMQWLASWLRRQDASEYKEIICSSPADLWGTPLVDLQEDEISPIETINHKNSVDSGTAINLPLSDNVPRQYTTQSTNYNNASQDAKSDFVDNSKYSYEKRKIKNKVYHSNKKDGIRIKYNQSENEVLVKNGDVKFINISLAQATPATSSTQTVPVGVSGAINQAGKVAITETTTSLKQTAEQSNFVAQNANETAKSQSNKPDQERFIAEISRNLFIASEERTFNNTLSTGEDKEKSEVAIDKTENVSIGGEMSMYTNNKQTDSFLLHPGMIILAVGVMGAAAALAMLAARFTRKRRTSSGLVRHEEDMEVTSLPSVTELW